MESVKCETGEIIETYVYRTDESTGRPGTYGYNMSSLIMFLTGTVIVVGIICYWLDKKKNSN